MAPLDPLVTPWFADRGDTKKPGNIVLSWYRDPFSPQVCVLGFNKLKNSKLLLALVVGE